MVTPHPHCSTSFRCWLLSCTASLYMQSINTCDSPARSTIKRLLIILRDKSSSLSCKTITTFVGKSKQMRSHFKGQQMNEQCRPKNGRLYYNIRQQKPTNEVSLQWPTQESTMLANEWQVILQHLSAEAN